MKKIKSEKKYECPFCQLGSSRRFNMEVHIKRIHSVQQQKQQQPKTEFYNQIPSTTSYHYNEHLYGEIMPQLDSGNALHESRSLQSFPSPFLENSYFEFLENQQKLERRANERKFYRTINEFRNFLANFNTNIINIPFSYYQFPFDNTGTQILSNLPNNSTNIKNSSNSKLIIEPSTKMPCAHKIYKCKRCEIKNLLPIFDFDNIISSEKFEHKCVNDSPNYYNEVEYKEHSCSIYDSLVSIINGRINSEKIIVKTFALPQVLIQNPICFFILEIIKNIFDLNLIPNKIFNLLKIEKFIDLGEINHDHWAYRAYNSPNEIFLEKEELQYVIKTLNSTFAFLTFKINNSRKFIFCYIPLHNKLDPR